MWFQQDGATSHAPNPILALLHARFFGRVIPRFDDANWLPSSGSPRWYFLCRYAKENEIMDQLLSAMYRQVLEKNPAH